MKIKFLGTGAAYYPPLGSTSAYFVAQKHLYLIDCGETVFSCLWSKDELKECEDVQVLITHLHADHIGSLGSFISYCVNVLKKAVTVITPDKTIATVLSLTGLPSDTYSLCDNFTGIFPGNIKIIPHAAIHDPSMKCYGFLLGDGKDSIYYGGDCYGIPDDILQGLQDGKIKQAFQEVTYEKGDHPGHSSLEQLCQLIPENLRPRIVCMHIGGNFGKVIEAAGFRLAQNENNGVSR